MATRSHGSWLLVSVMLVNLIGGLQEAIGAEVVADVGSSAVLTCKSDDGLIERCVFTRPDGNTLCTDSDEEVDFSLEIDCEKDKSVFQKTDEDICQLTIPKVANTHLGVWKCETLNWIDKVTTTLIEVRETSGPKKFVEFLQIDEFDVINIAKTPEKTFQCGVFSQSKLQPLLQNPGEMVWKVGSKVVATSGEYLKDTNGNFVQKFNYKPKLTDNKSKLSCSLKSGESSDEVELIVISLESLSKDLPIEVVNADKVITKKFKAVPAPEKFQVYWEISTSKGTRRVFQGKSDGAFKADLIKALPNNQFEASITITSPMDLKNDNPAIRLSIQVGPSKRTDFISIPVKLQFSDTILPAKDDKKVQETTEATVHPKINGLNENDEHSESDHGNDEEVVEKAEAKSNNTSIFIIIIIIMLVVIVCAVYYCCKCRFNISGEPEPRAQPVRNLKDVEEGKPLVGNSIDQPDGSTNDKSNPGLEHMEKDLLAKLDPSPEESEEKIIKAESQAKREAFAAAGAKKTSENESAIHDEIAKMAEIILSFEEDDLLPRNTEVQHEKVQNSAPIPEHERLRSRKSSTPDNNSVDEVLENPEDIQTATDSEPKNEEASTEDKESSNRTTTTATGSDPTPPSPVSEITKPDPETETDGSIKASKPPKLSIPTQSDAPKKEDSENPVSPNSLRSVSTQTPLPHRSFKSLHAAATNGDTTADLSSDEDSQSQHW